MEKKSRLPTSIEFLNHIKELEKQNLYGGAVDTVSPLLAGSLTGQGTKALLQRNPIQTLGASLFGLETGDYIGGKQTKQINDKTLYPNLKYLKKLDRESAKREKEEIAAEKAAIERLRRFKK